MNNLLFIFNKILRIEHNGWEIFLTNTSTVLESLEKF